MGMERSDSQGSVSAPLVGPVLGGLAEERVSLLDARILWEPSLEKLLLLFKGFGVQWVGGS